VQKKPQPLTELRPDLPEGFMPVLERMMAKNPKHRYQTPAEVALALQPFTVATAVALAPKPSPRSRPTDPDRTILLEQTRVGDRRRPRFVTAAAILAFLVAGLLGGAVYRIATDKGELVIETDNDDVEVVVRRGGTVVKIIDTKTGRHVTLNSGDYELSLKDGQIGLKLSPDRMTLKRGETKLATITREPARRERTQLTSTGWGNLKGRVTLDGPPPDAEIKAENEQLMAAIDKNKENKDYCLSGDAPEADKEQQGWRIGEDGAVQNVVVFLKTPDLSEVFRIDESHKTWKDTVVLDQPFCAFEPHIVLLFPKYYDIASKKQKSTGQKFKVKNGARIVHKTQWSGGAKNPGEGVTLAPWNRSDWDVSLEPSSEPVAFRCMLHGWMNAYAWVLDHPYAAVTDKDGNYEIKNAPAGVEVRVVAWHEKAGYLEGGTKGTPIKLKEGADTTKDFKVKAK
jgi:hypothetical protein